MFYKFSNRTLIISFLIAPHLLVWLFFSVAISWIIDEFIDWGTFVQMKMIIIWLAITKQRIIRCCTQAHTFSVGYFALWVHTQLTKEVLCANNSSIYQFANSWWKSDTDLVLGWKLFTKFRFYTVGFMKVKDVSCIYAHLLIKTFNHFLINPNSLSNGNIHSNDIEKKHWKYAKII